MLTLNKYRLFKKRFNIIFIPDVHKIINTKVLIKLSNIISIFTFMNVYYYDNHITKTRICINLRFKTLIIYNETIDCKEIMNKYMV